MVQGGLDPGHDLVRFLLLRDVSLDLPGHAVERSAQLPDFVRGREGRPRAVLPYRQFLRGAGDLRQPSSHHPGNDPAQEQAQHNSADDDDGESGL